MIQEIIEFGENSVIEGQKPLQGHTKIGLACDEVLSVTNTPLSQLWDLDI